MTEQELTAVVYELKGSFQAVEKAVEKMDTKLDQKFNDLPCTVNSKRIEILEDCQEKIENKDMESFKGNISLRNTIITSLVTLFLGIIGTLITLYVTGGK